MSAYTALDYIKARPKDQFQDTPYRTRIIHKRKYFLPDSLSDNTKATPPGCTLLAIETLMDVDKILELQ